MNEYDKTLMLAPSLTPGYCVCCGIPYTEGHHVVYRSHGGHNGPILSLCQGCHDRTHANRLHFRYTERWEWLATAEPVKYEVAIEMQNWRRCSDAMVCEC